MLRCLVVLLVLCPSAALAAQRTSQFRVGLTITGTNDRPAAAAHTAPTRSATPSRPAAPSRPTGTAARNTVSTIVFRMY
jgi:hypothetical protein